MPVNTSTSARATVEVEDGIVNSPATHSVATACWKLNRGNKILALVALVAMSVALGLALSSRENKTDRDLIPSQVIGGSVAGSYRYSYAVSLQHRYGHLCGGSLITRDIVLTAAHCWKGFFDPFTGGVVPSLKAVAGRHDLNDVHNGESIPILGSISHPNYNATTMDNDFMLVFLETGFTAGNVGLVKLNPDVSLPSEGQDLTTIGWGDADVRVCREQFIPQQLKLKHLNLKAFSNEHCDAAGGYYNGTFVTLEGGITDTMLCAFANPDESSCSGDSGGPLVIKGADAASDLQVGVVSFVLGECASDFPVVYSRVSGAYDWIQSEVCAYNSNTANEAGFVCPLVSTWSPTASPITTVAPTFAPSMQCDADTPCAEGMCCSQWGYCGTTEEYCGECCVNGCSSSTLTTATLGPTFGTPSTSPLSTFLPMSQQFTAPPSTSPPITYEPTSQQSLAFDVPTTYFPPSTINPILLQPSTFAPGTPFPTFDITHSSSTLPPQITPFPTFDTTHSLSTLPPQIHITPFPTFEATSTPPTVNGTSLLSLVPSEQ